MTAPARNLEIDATEPAHGHAWTASTAIAQKRARDATRRRKCSKCGETKALLDFPTMGRGDDTRRNHCRDCYNAQNTNYRHRTYVEYDAWLERRKAEQRAEWAARGLHVPA